MAGVISTVTSKGQVTIPAAIRRLMNLQEGDRLMSVEEAGRVFLHKLPGRVLVSEVYGVLRRPGAEPLDDEETMEKVKESLMAEDLALRSNPRDEHGC